MGFAQVLTRAHGGLAAPLVRVEVHLGSGLPSFTIVGLPAPVVRESRERVRAALAHCGFELPAGRITVNLAPAEIPKQGCRFDLPIALGILLASGQAQPTCDLATTEFYGELGLTGDLRPVPGLLLAALEAAAVGHTLFVPVANASAVAAMAVARVHAIAHLRELASGAAVAALVPDAMAGESAVAPPLPELADVRGQWQAKRALVIAAAGGHSLLMRGPPGSGKSMLAQRLPALLPPLSRAEALEVAAIAAAAQDDAGVGAGASVDASGACGSRRPFRAPHHTASAHAIVGGGAAIRPGEISLAHHGVLFLDELPEFDRRVLEALREPLESGRVSVVRANQRADFPAQFQLVAAMNPCPCGNAGLATPRCRCKPRQIQGYRSRISGPLLDRIDLQVELPPVDAAELLCAGTAAAHSLTSADARRQVCAARQRQLRRQGKVNARLEPAQTLEHCGLAAAPRALLQRATSQRGHSARSQHRILRVARSIADLADRDVVTAEDLAEALAMRWEDT
ncbi:MAG: YifB family Mg chelatase-like AAA ATPase [Steroidobacteraceae bacterium]